jgi:hypothetical protein
MYGIDKVLRDARAGRKIDAIKELRAITGLGLKQAKDLVEAIADRPAAKADPLAGRVLVVDSKNPDRVLGSIERPRGNSPRLDGGDCYNIAVAPRITAAYVMPYDPCEEPASIMHVRFGFRCVNWQVVLTTDASLETLTKIEHFRLPGETAEQAHVRSMYR